MGESVIVTAFRDEVVPEQVIRHYERLYQTERKGVTAWSKKRALVALTADYSRIHKMEFKRHG